MKVMSAVILGLATVASTAAAQRADRKVEQPIVRSFNWFSYVAGDDIRAACGKDGRNRLRLVYNAIYNEQVRAYEIFLQPDGTAGMQVDVLADQGDVSNLSIGDAGDVTKPWRMKRGQRVLNPTEAQDLLTSLQQSAAFGPPHPGLKLPDIDFWWTVASCVDGVWGFQAYHYPTDGFANVKFAAKLFSWDPVHVAVNPPRALEPAELRKDWNAPPNHMRANKWTLTVGKDGLQAR